MPTNNHQQDNPLSIENGINFTGFETNNPSIIKVIGVGGGGGNAVNHMYNEGIHDVTYLVCNTDNKALKDSPIPSKLQLGKDGLGAGNKPERARVAAEDSLEDIKHMLNDGTRMVFITAGMGGGTGTGAAPVIAQCAKDSGILTVGIVTIPFRWEGTKKIDQALDGVDELSKHVDALLIINNERLRTIYPELTVRNAFEKADDTLSVAARSIADIITMHGIINLDFQDVTTVLKDGGVAVMSTGYAEGEKRVTKAIQEALNSPLLNETNVFNSRKVLININFAGEDENSEMKMEEMNEIHDFMSQFRDDVETKWGIALDDSLGDKVKITLLATGFGLENVPVIKEKNKIEQIRDIETKEIEEKNKGDRREDYYGGGTGQNTHSYKICLLSADDMDNEDLITLLESSTTSERSSEGRKQIENKRRKSEPVYDMTHTTDNKIQFN